MSKIICISLNAPYGRYLITKNSSVVVFSMPFDISGKPVGIIENSMFLGIGIFGGYWLFNNDNFSDLYDMHKISIKDKEKIWPNAKKYYFYKTEKIFVAEPSFYLKFNKVFGEMEISQEKFGLLEN